MPVSTGAGEIRNKKKPKGTGGVSINRKTGEVTVYDVAREAKVSVSTVSKVLSASDYHVAEKTRRHILEVAKAMQYSKLYQAYAKREHIKTSVAVIVPNILNPYYASLVTGLEGALQAGGMQMVLYNSRNDWELEVKYAGQLLNENFAGVIIASICAHHEHINKLIHKGIKVLAFEQQVDLKCNRVCFNYKKGGFMATDFLLQKGKRKIGFISSPLTRPSRKQVYEGFLQAFHKRGLEPEPKYIRIAQKEEITPNELFEYQNGMEQVQEMIRTDTVPEAIFSINDLTAIGVMKTLQNNGYRIPGDVGVVGFDNIYLSTMVLPTLTTIEQSTYELGSLAAEILIGSIHDPGRNEVSIMLEPKLIVRESV